MFLRLNGDNILSSKSGEQFSAMGVVPVSSDQKFIYSKDDFIIKNYKFINYLGSGSFGKVFLA